MVAENNVNTYYCTGSTCIRILFARQALFMIDQGSTTREWVKIDAEWMIFVWACDNMFSIYTKNKLFFSYEYKNARLPFIPSKPSTNSLRSFAAYLNLSGLSYQILKIWKVKLWHTILFQCHEIQNAIYFTES